VSDLRTRERDDPDWDGIIVDLVEEDRVVGYAYQERGVLFAEFFSDEDGKPWVFEVEDLQRALDTAAAILIDEDEDDEGLDAGPHPVEVLALEFDVLAARRGPEDEGFYPLQVAARVVRRAGDLGLAVVLMDGLTLRPESEEPVPGCAADLGAAYEGENWAAFQAGCNTQATALLERWPRSGDFAVALEVRDRAGEQFVL
jgi:hypothetical protein